VDCAPSWHLQGWHNWPPSQLPFITVPRHATIWLPLLPQVTTMLYELTFPCCLSAIRPCSPFLRHDLLYWLLLIFFWAIAVLQHVGFALPTHWHMCLCHMEASRSPVLSPSMYNSSWQALTCLGLRQICSSSCRSPSSRVTGYDFHWRGNKHNTAKCIRSRRSISSPSRGKLHKKGRPLDCLAIWYLLPQAVASGQANSWLAHLPVAGEGLERGPWQPTFVNMRSLHCHTNYCALYSPCCI
jgi:hypothetical protein